MSNYNVTIIQKVLRGQKNFYYLGERGNSNNYLFGFKYKKQATEVGMWKIKETHK